MIFSFHRVRRGARKYYWGEHGPRAAVQSFVLGSLTSEQSSHFRRLRSPRALQLTRSDTVLVAGGALKRHSHAAVDWRLVIGYRSAGDVFRINRSVSCYYFSGGLFNTLPVRCAKMAVPWMATPGRADSAQSLAKSFTIASRHQIVKYRVDCRRKIVKATCRTKCQYLLILTLQLLHTCYEKHLLVYLAKVGRALGVHVQQALGMERGPADEKSDNYSNWVEKWGKL